MTTTHSLHSRINDMQKHFYFRKLQKLSLFALFVTLGMLSACKHYRLGSPATIPFKSIYIAPVSNQSYAPQAQTIVSAMLRENFIRDARVKVVANKENADAILFVDLTDYERDSTARSQQDTAVADSFDLRLKANFSLLNQQTDTYFFTNHSAQATTNAYTSNPYDNNPTIEFQLSERQAMEQLARDLARKISNEILNPW